jgi:hypothetical protein
MATVGGSLTSALTVFLGGATGYGLTSLYRGGTYVPNYASYSGVDSSGAGLALSQLVGLVYPVVSFAAGYSGLGDWLANASLSFNTNGTIVSNAYGSHTWLLYGSGSQFQYYFTVSNDHPDLNHPTFNTWLSSGSFSLSTTQFGGSKTASGVVYVRETTSLYEWNAGTWDLEVNDNS